MASMCIVVGMQPNSHAPMQSDTIKPASLFRENDNCSRHSRASHATVLIDYANYYHALYEALLKARHSVFALGWDIDGRIRLVRDGAEKGRRTFFEIIQHIARERPELDIYLNRWDYSAFMAGDRELLGTYRWNRYSPPNIRYCLDSAVPTGACHHQKVIVIDDEVAFCGGMDIALNRWDQREHYPTDHRRIDPGAMDSQLHLFEPYHDIQMVVAGPVVRELGKLCRARWDTRNGYAPVPPRDDAEMRTLPQAWPESYPPQFRDASIAIALTLPEWGDIPRTYQVEKLYIDMIAQAENFIYCENQFLCQEHIARAINAQLRAKPGLRVLMVSCYEPRGIFEKKSMWAGRVQFRDMVESGVVADRVTLTYPMTRAEGVEKTVRIHSKFMVVDDKYIRVGSSNINNRSMRLDTECDLVIEAENEETRQQIAAIRNDLIREHTGQEIATIQEWIDSGAPSDTFLNYRSTSRQHLCKINDEIYRHEKFRKLVTRVADPYEPLLPVHLSMAIAKIRVAKILLILAVIAGLALVWKYTPLAHYASPDYIIPLLKQLQEMPYAVPLAIGLYTICTLAFFPHMAMTGTIVLVFPPLEAFTIAMSGSLISGAIGFFIGKALGMDSMRSLLGGIAEKISGYAKKGGILGITVLRMIPVAPYTAVNLALGMLEIPFFSFCIGTFLGTLPGTAIASYLGHSVMEVWRNPNDENLWLLGGGLLAWVAIIIASHRFARWWRLKHGDAVTV